MKMRSAVAGFLLAAGLAGATAASAFADEAAPSIKAGIIGLDTSHAVAFTQLLNAPKAIAGLEGVKVVAAYPGGSRDLPASWDRVKQYTEEVRRMHVEIVDSIDELLKRVDVVLLESVDGRPHLAQARPVVAAGKPLFVDKPMAASLADAMEIFRLAEAKRVPCFSASALRFVSDIRPIVSKDGPLGEIKSCVAWSPLKIAPHHPDLFWYGIHGVELLYTVMGPGCKTVTRAAPDRVVGLWKDGRTGTFVAKEGYGAEIQGANGSRLAGNFTGYQPLVVEIVRFFKTGRPPVRAEETLEILAFMEAADASKARAATP